MRRFVFLILAVLGVSLFAPGAFAADQAAAPAINWVAVTTGFAMAVASAVCGYAQAKAASATCEGLARNPGAAAPIRFAFILAMVLIESMALYTFAICAINIFR
jgi:F-type H+-transporting ATPase subunit c